MDAELLTNEELVLELMHRDSFGIIFIATGEPEKIPDGANIGGWKMYDKGLENPIKSLKSLLKVVESQGRGTD